MPEYTPYQQRIRECFAVAYNFLDKHKHPVNSDDWGSIVAELGTLGTDTLTQNLIMAVMKEFEWDYEQRKQEG